MKNTASILSKFRENHFLQKMVFPDPFQKNSHSEGIFVPVRHKNAFRYRFSLEGSGTFSVLVNRKVPE
jgi:hypothetical protein